MARFSDLPEELVFEIFLLLPVDSLMRSKCVQKSWYALISSPKFIAKQLHDQISNKNNTACVLLFLCKSYLQISALCFLSFDDKTETFTGDHDQYHAFAIEKNRVCSAAGKYSQLSCHCHGIICLYLGYDTVVLANPAIRESRELPRSNCIHTHGNSFFGVGFGYDPKSYDYKVVRFFCPRPESPMRAEVYALSTDSWRELSIENKDCLSSYLTGVLEFECQYINGTCYWLPSMFLNKEQRCYFILLFDMSDEVFRIISLPNCMNTRDWWDVKLKVLNENLALVLIKSPVRGGFWSYEIWVMNGLGADGRTWNRVASIELNRRLQKPLAFWKNGDEIIMEDDDNGGVCCYYFGTQELKSLPVQHENGMKYLAVNYISSLVSVRGGNR